MVSPQSPLPITTSCNTNSYNHNSPIDPSSLPSQRTRAFVTDHSSISLNDPRLISSLGIITSKSINRSPPHNRTCSSLCSKQKKEKMRRDEIHEGKKSQRRN
jgi:hypothetical protein